MIKSKHPNKKIFKSLNKLYKKYKKKLFILKLDWRYKNLTKLKKIILKWMWLNEKLKTGVWST